MLNKLYAALASIAGFFAIIIAAIFYGKQSAKNSIKIERLENERTSAKIAKERLEELRNDDDVKRKLGKLHDNG